MAVIKCFAPNPTDGTATFDKVRFYEADDANGTNAALIATVSISTTEKDLEDRGFTSYLYTTGSTSKYYAASYYNSTSLTETSKGAYIKGGRDRLDDKFLKLMEDTAEAVFDSTSRDRFLEATLEALYPEIQKEVVDTSLAIVKTASADTLLYSIPEGFSIITRVGVGAVETESDYAEATTGNWTIEGNKLHFYSIDGYTNADVIRLIGLKKYLAIGEVPERYDPLMLLKMEAEAYRWMAKSYPRFEKWAQLQPGTKVSFENLRVSATNLEGEFMRQKMALAKHGGEEDYR